MAIDEARLEQFIHTFAGDFGVALHASTVVVGDKLGLYRALDDLGPTGAEGLATATGCDTRLVQALPEYEKALKAAGIRHEIIVYPDVDHAFHNDTSAERYNAAAAKQAWERAVAFLAAETGAA